MNFCPSLDPWLKAIKADERTWSTRNLGRARDGTACCEAQYTSTMIANPAPKPSTVESTRPCPTLTHPSSTSAPGPAVA
jgi:hypothetical protein